MPNYRVVASERRHAGKVFDLVVDSVEYDSGATGVREVAVHPGGAVVVPILDDGRVVLVRQYRHPAQRELLELPAGRLERGEDPAVCAARELEEETGFTAGSIVPLASFYTTPGFCSEMLHVFLGRGLKPTPGGQRLELGESTLQLVPTPFAEALALIERGGIVDAKTICGLLLAERRNAGSSPLDHRP